MASDAVAQVRQLRLLGYVIEEVFGASASSIWYAILSHPAEAEITEVQRIWIILQETDVPEVQDLMVRRVDD
jgi:hypothetical protein